jgi:methionyl-tRNA formyltransferase
MRAMSKIRAVFWGSPSFSIPSLAACLVSKDIEVIAVITQPDKPTGRSKSLQPSPVKQFALKHAISIIQPEKLSKNKNKLISLGAYDINIIVAYGKLIPLWALTIPRYKSINLHPSMLPRYRGPAPIHFALLHGDSMTGITIMLIDEELDHGPILAQIPVMIEKDATYLSLLTHLSEVGAHLLIKTTIDYMHGNLTSIEQDHTKATYTNLLSKDDGLIDWRLPSQVIYNQIRALNPWPGTFTFWNGKRLKITKAQPITSSTLKPGDVAFGDKAIHIGTNDKDMIVLELQLEGKEVQSAIDFMRGNSDFDTHELLD